MTGLYVASNPTALTAQFQMQRNMGSLGNTLTRLSTGLRINSGKDDPAGLIASELLKAQLTGTNKAITNTQRANALVATADSSLGMISNLLNDIKGLVVEAANTGVMTADQIKANQLQVDAALDSIDRIARTSNYAGKKLLDGSLDFRTAGASGGISNIQVHSANFGTSSAVGVNVNVLQNADYARLISNGTGLGVATVFDVVGARGSATVSMGGGSTNDQIAAAINKTTDSTGVMAYVEGKAERGSIVLSSSGANNDILITTHEQGFDAGNYAFRITRSSTGENDVRIVQEAVGGKPGVVEIALVEGTEQRYNDFAGLFNIVIDTTGRETNPDGTPITTSVNMTRGTTNSVTYTATDRHASSNIVNSKSIITSSDVEGTTASAMNGWTVAINNDIAKQAGQEVADMDTKTVYINTSSSKEQVETIFGNALAKTELGLQVNGYPPPNGTPGDPNGSYPVVKLDSIGFEFGSPGELQNGDRYTFTGGAAAGEVNIVYKEGATVNDILKMINNAPSISAALASGVDGNALIKNIPDGVSYSAKSGEIVSRYSSGATAQDVIELINSKMGDKFIATALNSDGTSSGRVSFMDASVEYGDINLGNAMRFTGMDNGPIIRMTNLGANGSPVIEQKLSVNIIHPSEADIKAGINTPILEIKLATDKQGNSITTAKDIVDLFKTLTSEQTLGVSVSQLYPPGVDPNGRIFGVDGCGKAFVVETCPTPIDGIVQPTGAPGPCGPQQGDLVLLGTNQYITADNAVAKVAGNNRPTKVDITEVTSASSTNANSNRIALANAGSTDGNAADLILSDRFVNALGGMTIAIDATTDATATGVPPASFQDGVLTLNMGAAAITTIDGASIADALNSVLDLRSYDQYSGLLTEINNWRTSNGLAAIDSSFRVANEDVELGANADPAGSAAVTTIADGASFTVAKNPSTGPTLTFSVADAQKLDGITFKFAESGTTTDSATYDAGSKTITIAFGVDTGGTPSLAQIPADDLEFAQRVSAALSGLTAAGNNVLSDLGFEDDQAINLVRAAGHGDLELEQTGGSTASVPAVAARGTTGQLTVGTNPPVSFTISTGDQGEHTAALNGMKVVFTTDGSASTYDADSKTLSVFLDGTATTAIAAATDAAGVAAALETALRSASSVMETALGLAAGDLTGTEFTVTASGTGSTAGFTAGDVTPAMLEALSAATLSGGVNQHDVDISRASSTKVTAPLLVDTTKAITGSVLQDDGTAESPHGSTILTFENTSALNGITFGFTRDEKREGFDAGTGTLMVYLGPNFGKEGNHDANLEDQLRAAINDGISANWEAIRAKTGATTDAVRLADVQDATFTVDNALHDASLADKPGAQVGAGRTMISSSYLESNEITGTRGVATDDPVLIFTALEKGTQMAGYNFHFVNDTESGLREYNNSYSAAYGANDELPDLNVRILDHEDGTKEVIITANLGAAAMSELNAGVLAKALNANAKFSSLFKADATQFGEGAAISAGVAGSVLFNRDISKPSATTVGGYKVESTPLSTLGNVATSSGIGMFGQSDSNERLVIESEMLGSDQFVQINIIDGYVSFVDEYGTPSTYATGVDMNATINGLQAVGKGNSISLDTPDLSVSMNMANARGSYGFSITGGGALFQLGPDVVTQQQTRLGIASMLTTNLGGASGQLYQLRTGQEASLGLSDNSRRLADRIVNEAISNVANIRGRLGAIQRGTLEPNIMALQDSLTAITENNAMITNADFAVEAANLSRLQLLVQAGAQTLGIANQLPQYAASLVR